nr:transposase [Staphylococcus hyicus]
MKSKNTTFEERIEIVNDCLNNGLNYKETAKHFNIKYSQIYAWVKNIVSMVNQGFMMDEAKVSRLKF